jgi:hypothetical protein
MKFLCVECDEPMKLLRTAGPDAGSMSVVFGCPVCGRETAMLTNAMETQMVRSLGVKIGGRNEPAQPMEMVRTSLAHSAEIRDGEAPHAAPSQGSSKCPFTGMVSDAFARDSSEITWSPEAQARLACIPAFAQSMAKMGIEMHARERGYTRIDDAVMDEVKGRFGM